MEPGSFVDSSGKKPAVVMGQSGKVVTYQELDSRSKKFAQLLHSRGLRAGDHIAVLLENHPRYFEVFWAAQRSGLYFTPINWHLRAEEVAYIIEDCGASALVTSTGVTDVAEELEAHLDLDRVATRVVMDGEIPGWESYEEAVSRFPAECLAEEVEGTWMFYSSGTTGRPKGIKPQMSTTEFGTVKHSLVKLLQGRWGFSGESVYLCPAPLYHAAPLGWSTSVQRLGGTVVVMEHFDPVVALGLIEKNQVTHAQFVPTHFVRMLKLPEQERSRYDLSSLEVAVHAAAPCPVEVKERMMEWWGPIIHEYYSGSEGNGFCAIGPEEWREHRGSVGKPLVGRIHIVGEGGEELAAGETGEVWFESDVRFEYHNDPEKTREAFNEEGWSSLGDVGYLDEDGYLFLTDRVAHTIISGGVNIYPQEVENVLALHPDVGDVAVIGVPNADMGEEVKAVVEPADRVGVVERELERRLITYCRTRLASYKCPRSVDFVDEVPRLPSGKLLKRRLRSQYWEEGG